MTHPSQMEYPETRPSSWSNDMFNCCLKKNPNNRCITIHPSIRSENDNMQHCVVPSRSTSRIGGEVFIVWRQGTVPCLDTLVNYSIVYWFSSITFGYFVDEILESNQKTTFELQILAKIWNATSMAIIWWWFDVHWRRREVWKLGDLTSNRQICHSCDLKLILMS